MHADVAQRRRVGGCVVGKQERRERDAHVVTEAAPREVAQRLGAEQAQLLRLALAEHRHPFARALRQTLDQFRLLAWPHVKVRRASLAARHAQQAIEKRIAVEQRRAVALAQIDQAVVGGHRHPHVIGCAGRHLQQQIANLPQRRARLAAGDAVRVAGEVVVGDVPEGDRGLRAPPVHGAHAAQDAPLCVPRRPVAARPAAPAQVAVEGAQQVLPGHVHFHVSGRLGEARRLRPDVRHLHTVAAQPAPAAAFLER